jgi:uncharacterized protein (DUF58 family)
VSEILDKWSPQALKSIGRLDFIAKEVLDGVKQGMHRSIRHGFSTEFFDYKTYQPGDDAQKIDWRLYSKTGKFFVKRFEADTSLECTMVLDCSPSMNWRWKDNISKREYVSVLAASLGMMFIEQRDHVGLLAYGSGATRYLPPKSAVKHLMSIFSELEREALPGATHTMLESVHELRSMKKHRGLIIVFSDLEIPEEEVMESLDLLRAKDDEVIVFHVLDEAEVVLPFGQVTHLVDSESGELMPVNFNVLKQEHAKRLEVFRDRFQQECRCRGITYVPLDTSYSYVRAVNEMNLKRKDIF